MTTRQRKTRKNTRWSRATSVRAGLALAGVGAIGATTLTGLSTDAMATGERTAKAGAAAHHGERAQLRKDARAVLETGVTGLTVRVQDERRRSTTVRAGVADLRGNRPVPYDAHYRIGSDTKTFTAVLVLQLVAEGKLDLDDTVEQWLPGLVQGNGNDGSRITVRNLLQQTSGLANYTNLQFQSLETMKQDFLANRYTSLAPEERVKLAMTVAPEWLPDAADPGSETRWSYSNTNYVLAGMIIEKITGNSWEREVRDRIVKPLRLKDTFAPGTSARIPRPTATAYTKFPGEKRLTETTEQANAWSDGAVISTTADMNTFLRALLGGRLLPAGQLAEMKRTVPAEGFPSRPGTTYGLGIAWRPAEGCDKGVWFHGGKVFGTVSGTAVTDDGRRSGASAAFTINFDDTEKNVAQDDATQRMLDRALCE
ncbi:peptidase [Streptomyces carminius]|uniref:Peptidase n=1 Tax=Streptomyces carminius TaxID=2665496 RepID=A0A2M8M5J1_9ACTN|nr:serine hydrolase domain-containing protein [Streptomyces carminius]PJE99475.1 peptidase [Streptomyces carminius]